MKLKVMPDFCSSGIWNCDNECMVDFDELNLPKDLVEDILCWIDFYDDECHEHENFSFIADEYKTDRLNKWGYKLAYSIKELYPNFDIVYIGENKENILEPITINL